MGEYADMMLDGTCCEACGAYIGQTVGYPQYCSDRCAKGMGYHESIEFDLDAALAPKSFKCPECKKGFRSADARKDHMKSKGHDSSLLIECSCGKLCKGLRGLNDHQKAKGCEGHFEI